MADTTTPEEAGLPPMPYPVAGRYEPGKGEPLSGSLSPWMGHWTETAYPAWKPLFTADQLRQAQREAIAVDRIKRAADVPPIVALRAALAACDVPRQQMAAIMDKFEHLSAATPAPEAPAQPIGPTGREPEMLQDADRKLSKWLSNTPNARQEAREAAQPTDDAQARLRAWTAVEQMNARDAAWRETRDEVGTDGWTTAESASYRGFFCHGWSAAIRAAIQGGAK